MKKYNYTVAVAGPRGNYDVKFKNKEDLNSYLKALEEHKPSFPLVSITNLDLEIVIHEIIGFCACKSQGITDDFVDGYLAAIEQRFFGGMRRYDRKKAKETINKWIEK